jgi:hypothetical protein
MRWIVRRRALAVTFSIVAFALSWWVCQRFIGLDEGRAGGIAAAVLAVLLAVAAWWAPLNQPIERSTTPVPPNSAGSSIAGPPQSPVVLYPQARAGKTTIVGEIPHEAAAFEPRSELQDELTANRIVSSEPSSTSNVSVIIGMRGVGKSQLASAIARRRLAEDWPVVAWIDAENMDQLTAGLGYLAAELQLNSRDSDPYESAVRLRHWLESDAGQCLLVLDNATDPDTVRHFLPVRSRAQIIITGFNRTLTSLGKPVEVDVFTPEQAVRFLTSRTGQPDSKGARQVASDLGFLPLALAQAASVIAGQNLSYADYRERTQSVDRLAKYLYKTADDPYPRGVVPAILLSLDAVEADGNAQTCRQVMEFAAFVSPAAIRRMRIYPAAHGSPADVDGALHTLVSSSLLVWTGADGSSVTAHRLVARVIRERAINNRTMPTAVSRISKVLTIAHLKHAADVEIPDEMKQSHALFNLVVKITAKVVRFMHAHNPVEELGDDETGCIFALLDNAAPVYDKLSIVCQSRLDVFQSYRDGYMFSSRLSEARAIENSGHLNKAAEAYEFLLSRQNQTKWPNAVYADLIRRDLARVRDKLQASPLPRRTWHVWLASLPRRRNPFDSSAQNWRICLNSERLAESRDEGH